MVASKPLFLCCRMYSELISAAIATGGPHASKTTAVKLMRRWAGAAGPSCCLTQLYPPLQRRRH